MSAVTQMVLLAGKPRTLQQVSQAAGTAIGDMVNNGGLAAAFDGVTSQATASCAVKTVGGGTVYIGKDWGSGVTRTIGKFVIWGSSDNGFAATGTGTSVTLALQGSTDNFASSNVTLYTSSAFTDSNGISKTYTDPTDAIDISTAYRYHRVAITLATYNPKCAELQFFEYA